MVPLATSCKTVSLAGSMYHQTSAKIRLALHELRPEFRVSPKHTSTWILLHLVTLVGLTMQSLYRILIHQEYGPAIHNTDCSFLKTTDPSPDPHQEKGQSKLADGYTNEECLEVYWYVKSRNIREIRHTITTRKRLTTLLTK